MGLMQCRRVSELTGGYVVNDLLCMLEQPYLRKNFVDDIVRLLLDIVKDSKSQVRHCPPTPGHWQGYQEPGTTLSAYSWTLSRMLRVRYDIVRLFLDIVKDTKSQVQHCPPTPGHCQGYQEPGTTLSAYSWTLSRIPRARYNPYVNGPPGSGSGPFYHQARYNSKKNLDSYCFVISL
jgi:hypothetical protein